MKPPPEPNPKSGIFEPVEGRLHGARVLYMREPKALMYGYGGEPLEIAPLQGSDLLLTLDQENVIKIDI